MFVQQGFGQVPIIALLHARAFQGTSLTTALLRPLANGSGQKAFPVAPMTLSHLAAKTTETVYLGATRPYKADRICSAATQAASALEGYPG